MDINQLEVLVAVAKEKSFSRAAETLNRTQPAVSQAIRRLEQEIGEKLFDRSSKDGTLTLAGELLLDYARQMLNLRQTAQSAIREMRDLQHGKLSISANEHTVFYLLPLISEYRRLHPQIKVEVQRGVASRIPKEIAAREAEIGVVSFKPNDPSVKAIPVGSDEIALFVAPSHALADKPVVSIRELGSETFIAHNAVSPYRQKVIEAFERHQTKLNIAVELPSLEAIKKLVEQGAGVALLPRLSTESEIRNGRLRAITVKEMRLERKLHVVYRKNSVLSHAAKAFLKLAKEVGS